MAYQGLPAPPKGFTDLKTAWDYPLNNVGDRHLCDMIGVCVDFLPVTQSRGSDLTMKLTIHDPYYVDGIGMAFQLFLKEESMAPTISNQGDVVIFRNAGTYVHPRYGKIAWSHFSSTWSVLECDSLRNSTAEDFSDVVIHRSTRSGVKAPMPDVEQIRYAKAILELENTFGWSAPQRATALEVNNIKAASGGTPSMVRGKDRQIKDLTIPVDRDCYIDLLAEVRRIYTTDIRMELSVTDYTDENQQLYDYKPESSHDSHDAGDRFGYIANTHKAWPGPWGRRTFTVTLWEPHRSYAASNVKHGSLVELRNVHVKLDPQAAKLEGIIHTDKLYPDKVLLSTLKPYEAETNEPLRDLLKRKKAYEDHCKRSGLRFIRDADPNKIPSSKTSDQIDGGRPSPTLEEAPRDPKSKRNRKKKEKQRAKAAAAAAAAAASEDDNTDRAKPSKDKPAQQEPALPSLAANSHVRTNKSSQSLISISEILDPQTRQQETMAGNIWTAPFVNRRYKSKVKVIDFYPDKLEDFAVRVKAKSEYAEAGIGSEDDDGSDEDDVDPNNCEASSSEDEASDNGNDSDDAMFLDGASHSQPTKRRVKWEWRFALVITDPTTSTADAVSNPEIKNLKLIVSGAEAEYLLRDTACNLRKNPAALARLREKLFVLWGDLEELLTEKSAAEEGESEVEERQEALEKAQKEYRSQPFECFVEEYGVLKGKKERGSGKGEKAGDWERCFRIWGTTVSG